MTIYPQIDISPVFDGGGFEISTVLRKKHTDGKWYLIRFWQRRSGPVSDVLRLFQIEVYRHLIQGIIDPEAKDMHGAPVFPLDEDQREESERLKEVFAI